MQIQISAYRYRYTCTYVVMHIQLQLYIYSCSSIYSFHYICIYRYTIYVLYTIIYNGCSYTYKTAVVVCQFAFYHKQDNGIMILQEIIEITTSQRMFCFKWFTQVQVTHFFPVTGSPTIRHRSIFSALSFSSFLNYIPGI